ncbi:MAG: glycosyltransferase [Paracoccaceae bacterium]
MNTVAVLLAVYNGEAHLQAQLDSISRQQGVDWSVIASDDNSTDGSLSVIKAHANQHAAGKVSSVAGPGRGGTANFLHLLTIAPATAGFFAFCDQDDVWLPHKLSRAVAALGDADDAGPAAYFSRTLVCKDDLSDPYPSPKPKRPFGFRNALVQNVMPGNTIVLNRAARALLQGIIAQTDQAILDRVVVHDWWVYQMLSGCDARLIFDAEPGLLYRQHGGNQIGANDGLRAKLYRIGFLLRGGLAGWNARNLAALNAAATRFTPENQQILREFNQACNAKGRFERLRAVGRAGLYRQGRLSSAVLHVAALMRLL